jgi:Stage II sporulation protein E (SpoIIE)
VPAALVTATTCGMLQAVSQAVGSSSSPGEVLAQVNETLLARIPANMFVTCFYAILEPKSASLIYANAGHDLPCLHCTSGEAEELRATGMPLGLMTLDTNSGFRRAAWSLRRRRRAPCGKSFKESTGAGRQRAREGREIAGRARRGPSTVVA